MCDPKCGFDLRPRSPGTQQSEPPPPGWAVSAEFSRGRTVALAARGLSGREKLPSVEVHFRREPQRGEPETSPASSGYGGGAIKPREEKRPVLSKVGGARGGQASREEGDSVQVGGAGQAGLARRRGRTQREKRRAAGLGPGRRRGFLRGTASGIGGEPAVLLPQVVIRRLPPSLTKEQLEEQLYPLPAHDYFEFFAADLSLHPHLYSRAYVNFRNPDDILLFRDRFDGYVFIDSRGLEYPAVVEFAPFQKVAKKKLKKKDAKTGSIEDDPEYKKFLEMYCVEEERTTNPETLLGEMGAKTRELLARRTTPLLEYIKNRKLEKQRMREEKREERRRRELEKKRLRGEEKRKRREEERCRRKEADKQLAAEKEVKIKLLKKPEKGEEPTTDKPTGRGEEAGTGEGPQDLCASCTAMQGGPWASSPDRLTERSQHDSDKEQRDMGRRFQEKEFEAQSCRLDGSRKRRVHCEADPFSRRNEDELKWGKGFDPDQGKKGSQDSSSPAEGASGPAPRRERLTCKDRLALQLYQPGARLQARKYGARPSEEGRDRRGSAAAEGLSGPGSEKRGEAEGDTPRP
ncbi:regulator of nonsense transcripts 3A [Tupaia chinensis]|uniref:regulator of nonsense transcripts 3A n=1 Tax=Tupaia chinensis TaxID=246437 RepID=UPI0007041198|nr:regulator of nonsense transcripts 3A [Tupaia chinensis]